ncbi:SDR family NAD(P)-dependent oxidoreductase [Halogeometricum limi]|uniref:NAD(P)-dependent dehydrogenase, short-chain alcohol dehydrogenase family n=1 Tax=Halogeometricum limi TaxID=555875 RepID=A0A1I6ILG6_9EURY|nr:glucose 1-dehydrogenase [Halogeometricum limi]SFR67479.1 NAD(P)-dependent dehydrogenase, short-chain alcohol dehydrogenase family [Halogeometricum limi]
MTTDRFGVAGQTAIVTGASSGIGKTIAEQFAAGGADVVVCSREQENVDPVADGINERTGDGDGTGGQALAVECDVTDRDAVEALVEATVEEFGGVDCLVNNAGASFMASFDDISENGWETIVGINLTGTYHCTQAAGEYLRDGGGTVLNLASVAGTQGAPFMSHYGAAKAGIVNLTTTLAYEWASEGVRVNCIAPGFVATPGVESQMGVSGENIDRDEVERRIGLTEEIADLAQFLASPASSYVVGETIVAQGVPQVMETPEV